MVNTKSRNIIHCAGSSSTSPRRRRGQIFTTHLKELCYEYSRSKEINQISYFLLLSSSTCLLLAFVEALVAGANVRVAVAFFPSAQIITL